MMDFCIGENTFLQESFAQYLRKEKIGNSWRSKAYCAIGTTAPVKNNLQNEDYFNFMITFCIITVAMAKLKKNPPKENQQAKKPQPTNQPTTKKS